MWVAGVSFIPNIIASYSTTIHLGRDQLQYFHVIVFIFQAAYLLTFLPDVPDLP